MNIALKKNLYFKPYPVDITFVLGWKLDTGNHFIFGFNIIPITANKAGEKNGKVQS